MRRVGKSFDVLDNDIALAGRFVRAVHKISERIYLVPRVRTCDDGGVDEIYLLAASSAIVGASMFLPCVDPHRGRLALYSPSV